ncbi:MAG: gliding motility-associated C-terminal domain-containing protein [Bacteroidetes bacterium]|nr:gliding motility-associated C-terminal domain-containing protein [Bacteroidota bacterium]
MLIKINFKNFFQIKRAIALFNILLILNIVSAQPDVGITGSTSPISGCMLTASETVSVKICNYGDSLKVPFNVSYMINNGSPVTENVPANTIMPGDTLTYSFSTKANLSSPGSFSIKAYTSLTADVNSLNDTLTIIVISYAASIGGSVWVDSTVCSPSNKGMLTLKGHNGNVIRWESSTDGGTSWTGIANTDSTQNYNNLTVKTQYRAVVQNGICPIAFSSDATIKIDVPPVGGSIGGSTVVCSSANNGTLTLSGFTGTVSMWSFSSDGGITWSTIANTGTTQTYSNLTQTRRYKAIIQNGVCPPKSSSIAVINVDSATVGGTVSGSTMVCSGINGGTLELTGHVGAILSWEFSTDGGSTWMSVSNTTVTQNYSNLTNTTSYRALVQSGICPSAYSSIATVTVNPSPSSVGGNISGSTTVCSNSNNGTLLLNGYTGNIVKWQSAADTGASWTDIIYTNPTLSYTNIPATRYYRVIVKSGTCFSDTSDIAILTVDSVKAGVVSSNQVVCSGSNGGTLTLSGYLGSISGWQFSTDSGKTWSNLGNTSAAYQYANLITTTQYRALVKNGVCPVVSSSAAVIAVDPATVKGTISGAATFCGTPNNGVLQLNGHVGNVLKWQYSSNSGSTWIDTNKANTSCMYNNLLKTSWYRVIVQSGVCKSDTTAVAIISIDSVTVAGTVSKSDSVCASLSSDSLRLSGYTGNILNWEYSIDGGGSWVAIPNTTPVQKYNNLTVTTMYRAIVKSGMCSVKTSNGVTIKVLPATVGGIVENNTIVCSGSNSGTLRLSSFVGKILKWESSTNGGATWETIANTSDTLHYSNLVNTTWYRAVVKNGICSEENSAEARIGVDASPYSVGGTASSDTTVCSNSNSGLIKLSGQTGSVIRWEYSIDGGGSWVRLSNTTGTQSYFNLSATTLFHAVVQSGVCNAVNSSDVVITVNPKSTAGNIINSASVCSDINNGMLQVVNYTGMLDWQSSSDGGASWNAISNSGPNQNYSNLTATTFYRVIAKSGICPADTSSNAVIVVDPRPTASFNASVTCLGQNTLFTNTSNANGSVVQSYQWDFGDNTTSIVANPTHEYINGGIYKVILTINSDKGCRDTSAVNVKVNTPPAANIGTSGPKQFCSGGQVILSAPSGLTYSWNTGSSNQTISAVSSGTYAVKVTQPLTGCSNSDSVSINVFPLPAIDAGKNMTISLGSTINLNGTGGLYYSWSPPEGIDDHTVANPSVLPLSTTTYSLTAIDNNGCANTDSVTIYVVADYKIIASNMVTPNGDGKNDTWYIENIENYTNNEVTIFNRYGQQVYHSFNYINNWDGRYNGSYLPDGAYYYVLNFVGHDQLFKGTITILKEQ